MHNAQWLIGANWANGTNRANGGWARCCKRFDGKYFAMLQKISIFAAQRERARAHVGPMHV